MNKILEAIKAHLKDGADLESLKTVLEPLIKELNPIDGVTTESLGPILGQNAALKAAFDRKVEETSKKRFESDFDKAYKDRFVKENPAADPALKEINELKLKWEQSESNSRRKDLLLFANRKAKDLNLPDGVSSVLDRFLGNDEDETAANLAKLAFIPDHISKGIEIGIKDKIKTTPRGSAPPAGALKIDDLANASHEEINAAFAKGLVV